MLKAEQGGGDWSNLGVIAEAEIQLDAENPRSYTIFDEMIGDLKLEVVVIDSLRRMHLGEDTGSRQSNHIFNMLKKLRNRHGVSFQVIAHWRKAKGDGRLDDPGERLSGSADWRNFVDSHISVVKHRTADHMLIYPDKGRHADRIPARFAIQFTHTDRDDPNGPFQIIMGDEKEQKADIGNYECILVHLQSLGEATTVKDISETTGIRRTTVARIVSKMEDNGDALIDPKSKPNRISPTVIYEG